MRLPGDRVVMQFGPKRRLHLFRRSGESDTVLAASNAFDGEPLLLQPRLDFCDIRVRQSKSVRELIRRKPLVVLRRGRVLLVGNQLLQRRFLRIRP